MKGWRRKWGWWSTRGSSKLESGDRTGFPPSHKWRVVLEATVCSGCYHAHFVLGNDSFIQGDMYWALQGQSAPSPTSSFFLCVLFSFQKLTFLAGVCVHVCMCVLRDFHVPSYPCSCPIRSFSEYLMSLHWIRWRAGWQDLNITIYQTSQPKKIVIKIPGKK